MRVRRARLRAASTHLGRARRAAPLDDLIVQCELLIEQAWIAVWSDRWDRALDLATSASRAAIAADEPALQFHAWSLIEQSRSAKGLPDADAAGQEALRAAHASGDERLVGLAEGNLALIADNRGRWKQAVNGYSRSGRAFRRCGDVVNVATSQLNQATILVELGDVETAYALAVDAARVLAAAGDAEAAAIATGLSLRAMVRAGLGDGTQVAGIETCVAVLAAEGDEEVTAFQDVGLIESLLLTGNIVAATQRAVRLIDVVDRFGDDHLLPTTVRRLLAVAADAAGDRSAGEQWLHEARARADLHRIMPEQAAIAAIDARRAADDRAPDRQRRADVSARLDEVLGVLSRPLFQHGRDSGEPMISGTELRPGRRRSPERRSPVVGYGGKQNAAGRVDLREPVGHRVEVETAAERRINPHGGGTLDDSVGELASGFDVGDHADRAVAPCDLSRAGNLFLQRSEHADALRIDDPTSGLVRTLERDAVRCVRIDANHPVSRRALRRRRPQGRSIRRLGSTGFTS